MSARFLCFLFAVGISLPAICGEDDGKAKPGKPKEVSVTYTFSNSSGGPLELWLTYQQKKNLPVEEHLVATVPSGTSKKGKERVVYNGLVGPAGKDGGFRVFQPNAQTPLAEKLFFVDPVGTGHNPHGNLLNPKTEQIDISVLPGDGGFPQVFISINPEHK